MLWLSGLPGNRSRSRVPRISASTLASYVSPSGSRKRSIWRVGGVNLNGSRKNLGDYPRGGTIRLSHGDIEDMLARNSQSAMRSGAHT